MDVISRRTLSSSLNPNAPLFVPLAYQTVEDFSDEWWALIQSSPWFRDYWLQECYEDDEEHHPQNDYFFSEIDDPIFPDIDAIFDGYNDTKQEEEEEEEEEEEKEISYRDLVTLGALKWRKSRVLPTRNREKVPKIVNVKVSPRPIQQPR